MFVINKEANTITALDRKTFSDLGFKERAHLQEWIAKNPDCLGERLLIIQKEFNGFPDTYERLDLLALDKSGNLVVIENKLDDSGRDVTWQALKYASYCSTLTKEDIRGIYQSYLDAQGAGQQAVEKLTEFFEDAEYNDLLLNQRMTQRIMLVAANFRKEVTSTVLWLMNFKIQLQCFKVTPYGLGEDIFLTLDQIIPTKDAQDYQISMANKAQEEIHSEEEVKNRHRVRLEFWAALLKEIKGKSPLFQNSNPTKDHWLVAGGTNIAGLSYQFVVTMTYAAVLFNIGRSSTEENKILFDALQQHNGAIGASFAGPLNWERLSDKKSSRLSFALTGVNYFNKDEWPKIIGFLVENINKLEVATKPYLPELKKLLSNTDTEGPEILS
ncbi:DUF4268 domain-containing protein [Flaviaesturariibacter amylovorans]|uniref:DUF4268 domain-containing protein n=1 Tax=Flaviaesturariibacter amylovorans TaxID=1084520 RepID=A0ABP8HR93_9BACT